MKPRESSWIEALRGRFVLTSAEWRIIIFVIAAFTLGIAAKHYRLRHPESVSSANQARAAGAVSDKPATQSTSTRRRKFRERKTSQTPVAPETSPDATERSDD